MPYYCTVPRCTSMAGKAKNVSFHQFPRDEELAKLWNKILKRGKPYTKYSKVCSLHFTPEDYTITSVGKNKGQWRTLRKDALPSQNLPSESPTPYQRKQWGAWTHNTPAHVLDPTIQQHMAQAIYVQTMLAIQAAGATEVPAVNHSNGLLQPSSAEPPLAHTSNTTDTDILKGKQTNTNEQSTSYKCTECSKCFKDPDVYFLHKRSHIKNEKNEKENFNLNLTLQANPILANLLKTNTENSNIYENNVINVENLLMTALAANMEEYMRNFTSIIKNDDRGDLSHDRGNVERDRSLGQRASYNEDRLDQSNRGSFQSRDRSLDSYRGENNDRGLSSHDIGILNNDGSLSNHDTVGSMENCNSDSNLIRDRIIELYRNNDTYNSDRNVRYYENDSEHNDRGYQTSDGVTNDSDRGVINDNRGVMNDDRAFMNDDRGCNGDVGFTNDDDNSLDTNGPICDSDLNESIDSNKLVIDEETV